MLAFSPWALLGLALLALWLDRLVGEPARYHPLIGFGTLAMKLEAQWNPQLRGSQTAAQPVGETVSGIFSGACLATLAGVGAWLLLVLPLPVCIAWLWYGGAGLEDAAPWATGLTSVLALVCVYVSVGWQSLREHGLAVATAFSEQGLEAAKNQVARIVSRDTVSMDESAVARATIESVLENGSDAIFAPLFWFAVLGPAGAVLYRLANTLDAMWGYRTPRLQAFGYCSAKMDDLLNWLPARLTALSYAVLGRTSSALRCWQRQARHCASPNGGPVMCSGAGALGVALGGGAFYHGVWQSRPVMGEGQEAKIDDIPRSIRLVDQTVWLWLSTAMLLSLCWWL